MWIALEQLACGAGAACVSAGNTGALMAMGRFALKTFVGIDRPAIAAAVPSAAGDVLLLDVGANVDCSAANLYQFAVMGSLLAASAGGGSAPRVGLLNVGTESIKGNEQVRQAHRLLQGDERLNYIGFIEGHDVFAGRAQVVVCDGFVGNIALKTGEGVACLIRDSLMNAFRPEPVAPCFGAVDCAGHAQALQKHGPVGLQRCQFCRVAGNCGEKPW